MNERRVWRWRRLNTGERGDMAKLSTYALAGALALALAPVAGRAADLPEPPLLEPVAPVEFGSAWYIRGDVGYKNYRKSQGTFSDSAYRAAGIGKLSNEKSGDAAVFGGGVGYKFNQWIRTDVTLDYETKSKFHGETDCIGGCGGRKSDNRTKIDAWSVFWNGYVDLFTSHGFTPYIGGGVGAARVRMGDIRYTDYPAAGGSVSGSYNGDAQWNFAWNLQAGVGFEVSPNMVIDANYRFVDLGDAKSKTIPAAAGDGKVKFKDLQAHEVRVGFRYLLD